MLRTLSGRHLKSDKVDQRKLIRLSITNPQLTSLQVIDKSKITTEVSVYIIRRMFLRNASKWLHICSKKTSVRGKVSKSGKTMQKICMRQCKMCSNNSDNNTCTNC